MVPGPLQQHGSASAFSFPLPHSKSMSPPPSSSLCFFLLCFFLLSSLFPSSLPPFLSLFLTVLSFLAAPPSGSCSSQRADSSSCREAADRASQGSHVNLGLPDASLPPPTFMTSAFQDACGLRCCESLQRINHSFQPLLLFPSIS